MKLTISIGFVGGKRPFQAEVSTPDIRKAGEEKPQFLVNFGNTIEKTSNVSRGHKTLQAACEWAATIVTDARRFKLQKELLDGYQHWTLFTTDTKVDL